jgi:hypothetical protein
MSVSLDPISSDTLDQEGRWGLPMYTILNPHKLARLHEEAELSG